MRTYTLRVGMMIIAGACFAPNLHAQTVLQWNLHNNCAYDTTCRNNEAQFIANLNPRPTIVAVQELPGIYVSDFATSLGNATGSAWNVRYAAHKQLNCTSDFDQGVAIFTTLPIVDSETKLFSYPDAYVCKRAAVRVALSINGSTVQVFTSHMTTNDAAGNSTAVGNWAATYSRPRLLSCDCNTTNATSLLKTTAVDAWPVVSSDPGVTFPGEGRIDYWFSDANDELYPIAADLPSTSLSDHLPLRVTYSANLLAKGGFEEYTPPALAPEWPTDRTTHAMSETNQPRTGLQNAACWQTDGTDCGVFQDFVVSTAGTYTFSVFAAADVAGGIVGANLNGTLAVPSQNVAANGFLQYSKYSFSFSASAGQTIRVWMYSSAIPGNPGHYVVIDDAALTKQ